MGKTELLLSKLEASKNYQKTLPSSTDEFQEN